MSFRLARLFSFGLFLLAASAAVTSADAQGKGRGNGGDKQHVPPGQKKKKVTTSDAVLVSREILVRHGFTVVRVERVGVTQVIYYRRGNNGRGKGLGPMEKMVVKPAGEVVVFESAPRGVLVDINIRLGL